MEGIGHEVAKNRCFGDASVAGCWMLPFWHLVLAWVSPTFQVRKALILLNGISANSTSYHFRHLHINGTC